jgi:hypothetical protein
MMAVFSFAGAERADDPKIVLLVSRPLKSAARRERASLALPFSQRKSAMLIRLAE